MRKYADRFWFQLIALVAMILLIYGFEVVTGLDRACGYDCQQFNRVTGLDPSFK
jgi:hypothetical protein